MHLPNLPSPNKYSIWDITWLKSQQCCMQYCSNTCYFCATFHFRMNWNIKMMFPDLIKTWNVWMIPGLITAYPIVFWDIFHTWWHHQMETFSALLVICAGNSPVPGEFPTQRSVTRSFDVFFDLRLNKGLSKQSWGWWFKILSRPL